VPIAIVASAGFESQTVVPIALGASAAMCLPISTPPNAIVYGTGELETRDLIHGGVLVGLLAPIVVTGWCRLVL
jgi:sodium-dependent dicarboxylate transporter 2/3/5